MLARRASTTWQRARGNAGVHTGTVRRRRARRTTPLSVEGAQVRERRPLVGIAAREGRETA